MDNMDTLYRRLDAWWDGTLNETEKAEIERLIETDAEWQAAYQQMYETREAVRSYQLVALKNELRTNFEREHTAGFRMLRSVPSYYYVAAAVILVLVIFLLLPSRTTETNKALYSAYFDPMEDMLTYLGPGKDSLMAAMAFYNQQDYPNAIHWLNNLSPRHPDYPTAQLYLANAYLANGQFVQAEPILRSLLTDPGNSEYARWYLALSLLGQDKREEAQAVLLKMKETSPVFKAKTLDELLARLP